MAEFSAYHRRSGRDRALFAHRRGVVGPRRQVRAAAPAEPGAHRLHPRPRRGALETRSSVGRAAARPQPARHRLRRRPAQRADGPAGRPVTGVDAAARNIASRGAACREAGAGDRLPPGRRRGAGRSGRQFDIVLALEIVEHVADVPLFLKSCGRMVKPGGLLFLSTLNRTAKAWALAIAGGEYILRWLPRGTHDWRKFLKPSEVVNGLGAGGHRGPGDRRRGLQPAQPRLVAQQERPRRELHAVWHEICHADAKLAIGRR